MAEADRDDDVMRLLALGRDREAAQRGAALAVHHAPHDRHGGQMDPLAQFEQLAPVLGAVIAGLGPPISTNQRPAPSSPCEACSST